MSEIQFAFAYFFQGMPNTFFINFGRKNFLASKSVKKLLSNNSENIESCLTRVPTMALQTTIHQLRTQPFNCSISTTYRSICLGFFYCVRGYPLGRPQWLRWPQNVTNWPISTRALRSAHEWTLALMLMDFEFVGYLNIVGSLWSCLIFWHSCFYWF